jgi:GT2 family glycosyltransferase
LLEFSIVVVTWNSAPVLERLVATIEHHLDPVPELIVVDNASDDDPEAVVHAYTSSARFVALESNLGYGAAANVGVERASAPVVVVLNPDIELIDGSLGELAAFAMRRGALAGPRLLNTDGSVQPSASGSPVGLWPWIGAVLPGRLQPEMLQRRTEPWRLGHTTTVAWLTGACIAAPRDVLLALGPFDPAIHLLADDLDLGLRAALAAIPSYLCPDVCRIVHHSRASGSIAFAKGTEHRGAINRRAVVRRVYGDRAERAGWRAARANLRLRLTAKRALGRDASKDRVALDALRSAEPVPELMPPLGRER